MQSIEISHASPLSRPAALTTGKVAAGLSGVLRSALARVWRPLVGRACAAAASALFCGRIERAHVLAVLQHVEAVHLEHGEQGDGGAVEQLLLSARRGSGGPSEGRG